MAKRRSFHPPPEHYDTFGCTSLGLGGGKWLALEEEEKPRSFPSGAGVVRGRGKERGNSHTPTMPPLLHGPQFSIFI